MDSIDLLKQTAPNWITVKTYAPQTLMFSAQIGRAGGLQSRAYDLRATCRSPEFVSVSEEVTGTLLPASCPERHVNPDGSFCVGLNAGKQIGDLTEAAAWWRKLEVFLECQETAHNTGRWPLQIQLSHGGAGAIQVQAEEVAKLCNRSAELEDAILFDSGPIAMATRNLEAGVKNARAQCLCGRTDKRGKPLIRKNCQTEPDECLVLLETKRRKSLRDFWATFKNERCCGSISTCLFKRD